MTWPNILDGSEVAYVDQLCRELAAVVWLQPLLTRLPLTEELTVAHKPLLFELRVGADLNGRTEAPVYEYATGVGDSSVDFRFLSERFEWYVECVSIGLSDAVRTASWDTGLVFGASLSSNAPDQRQTEQGELLLVQQKIGEKVLNDGLPTKFPAVADGRYHAIVADVRGFGLTGGDAWDYMEIAYGHRGIPDDLAPFRHWWREPDGSFHPILGLFERSNTRQRAARLLQERVHFLGFSWDQEYGAHTVAKHSFWCANPHLFASDESAQRAFLTLPVRPSQHLEPNVRD